MPWANRWPISGANPLRPHCVLPSPISRLFPDGTATGDAGLQGATSFICCSFISQEHHQDLSITASVVHVAAVNTTAGCYWMLAGGQIE